jgi:hypothetical protein
LKGEGLILAFTAHIKSYAREKGLKYFDIGFYHPVAQHKCFTTFLVNDKVYDDVGGDLPFRDLSMYVLDTVCKDFCV